MLLTSIKGEPNFMKGFESSDGSVTGVLAVHEDTAAIHEWNSHTTGQGNTISALIELHHEFRHLSAIGIGLDEDDPSWCYWVEMYSKGLVDRLEDDNGRDVTPSSVKVPTLTLS